MTRISAINIPIMILFIILTAGCVELFYPELGNQSQNTEKGNTGQVKLDIEYSPAALSKYPEIQYDPSEDAFFTNIKVSVSSELDYGARYQIRLKEMKSGWESSISAKKYVQNSSAIFKFIVPKLGYKPEFEACEQHAGAYGLGDYSQEQCIRKSLPPIEFNLDIAPSTVDMEIEPRKNEEMQVVISNKGIFSVSNIYFKEPKDPQDRVSLYVRFSNIVSTLNPGQSAPVTILASSRGTKEPFEFSGEAFVVTFLDNLGEYHYNKSFTINVRQK